LRRAAAGDSGSVIAANAAVSFILAHAVTGAIVAAMVWPDLCAVIAVVSGAAGKPATKRPATKRYGL
jgi:hypothetical protein